MVGIIGAPPLPVKETLDAFYALSKETKSHVVLGWGLSGYSAGHAVYFDRHAHPVTETVSAYVKAQDKALHSSSPVLMAHFSQEMGASGDITQIHPFHYRDFIFAHDGKRVNTECLRLNDAQPQGKTDSERLFLWIMENIYSAIDRSAALVRLLQVARGQSFNSLSFLLSDGMTLWAYWEGKETSQAEGCFRLYAGDSGKATVICSEPLKNVAKKWIPLQERTLAVYTTHKPQPKILTV